MKLVNMLQAYLFLDGVPCVPQAGVVIRAVKDQSIFKIPLGIFAHLGKERWGGGTWDVQVDIGATHESAQSYLVCVDKEQDEEDQFSQEDDQQNDEELKKG